MRRLSRQLPTIASLAGGALTLCCLVAAAQTATRIPHRGPVAEKPRALFDRLKQGFADGRYGPYQLVSSDPKTRTIVVTRNNVDVEHWTRWAYCSVSAIDMFDSLRDGAVRLTVKLEPTTRKITYAVVWADFTGTYGIASTNKVVQCLSTGVLEEDILRTAGATEH
jgi:hypothetical protein